MISWLNNYEFKKCYLSFFKTDLFPAWNSMAMKFSLKLWVLLLALFLHCLLWTGHHLYPILLWVKDVKMQTSNKINPKKYIPNDHMYRCDSLWSKTALWVSRLDFFESQEHHEVFIWPANQPWFHSLTVVWFGLSATWCIHWFTFAQASWIKNYKFPSTISSSESNIWICHVQLLFSEAKFDNSEFNVFFCSELYGLIAVEINRPRNKDATIAPARRWVDLFSMWRSKAQMNFSLIWTPSSLKGVGLASKFCSKQSQKKTFFDRTVLAKSPRFLKAWGSASAWGRCLKTVTERGVLKVWKNKTGPKMAR